MEKVIQENGQTRLPDHNAEQVTCQKNNAHNKRLFNRRDTPMQLMGKQKKAITKSSLIFDEEITEVEEEHLKENKRKTGDTGIIKRKNKLIPPVINIITTTDN